ncbi:MAG: hypothetical protein AB7L18_00345 [Hyphomicrobiaceae bacterium]
MKRKTPAPEQPTIKQLLERVDRETALAEQTIAEARAGAIHRAGRTAPPRQLPPAAPFDFGNDVPEHRIWRDGVERISIFERAGASAGRLLALGLRMARHPLPALVAGVALLAIGLAASAAFSGMGSGRGTTAPAAVMPDPRVTMVPVAPVSVLPAATPTRAGVAMLGPSAEDRGGATSASLSPADAGAQHGGGAPWHAVSRRLAMLTDSLRAVGRKEPAAAEKPPVRPEEPEAARHLLGGLNVPSVIDAAAGARTPHAVWLETKEAEASAASVLISGLSDGFILSPGRRLDDGRWRIDPRALSLVRIDIPPGAAGDIDLEVAVLDAREAVTVRAATRLHIAPQSSVPDATTAIVAQGRSLSGAGDIPGARLLLERAALMGSAEAAFLLGELFDASVLAERGARDAEPSAERARHWYGEAARQGHVTATTRLSSLSDAAR